MFKEGGIAALAAGAFKCLSQWFSKLQFFCVYLGFIIILKFSTTRSFLWTGLRPIRMSQNYCDRFNAKIRRILPLALVELFAFCSVFSGDLSHMFPE